MTTKQYKICVNELNILLLNTQRWLHASSDVTCMQGLNMPFSDCWRS